MSYYHNIHEIRTICKPRWGKERVTQPLLTPNAYKSFTNLVTCINQKEIIDLELDSITSKCHFGHQFIDNWILFYSFHAHANTNLYPT